MSRLSKSEENAKKEYSEVLYCRVGLNQKDIAQKVGVTEKTISKWKTEGEWDILKASFTISKDQELKRIYAQINELNTAIEGREVGYRYASSKESDTLTKLSATIRNLETDLGIADTVNVSMKMLQYVRENHFEHSKAFHSIIDQYIKSLIR